MRSSERLVAWCLVLTTHMSSPEPSIPAGRVLALLPCIGNFECAHIKVTVFAGAPLPSSWSGVVTLGRYPCDCCCKSMQLLTRIKVHCLWRGCRCTDAEMRCAGADTRFKSVALCPQVLCACELPKATNEALYQWTLQGLFPRMYDAVFSFDGSIYSTPHSYKHRT